jgi:hypothetical protein
MTVKANVRIMSTCCGWAAFGVIGGMLMDERISLSTWVGLWLAQISLAFVAHALNRRETNRFLPKVREDMRRSNVIALQAAYEQNHLAPEYRLR